MEQYLEDIHLTYMKPKADKKIVTENGMIITVSPDLDKYAGKILAPEKLEDAMNFMKKVDLDKLHKLIAESKSQ